MASEPRSPKKTRLENPPSTPFKVTTLPKVEPTDHPIVDQEVPIVVGNSPSRPAPPIANVQAELSEVNLNETKPDENGDAVVFSIVLRSYTLGDVGVMYNIQSDETYEAIYKDYASRIDVQPNQIKLYHGATFVPDTAYPEAMAVESGSVLHVKGLAGVVNTYTRVKRFYLKNTRHNMKKKLRIQGKLDTPTCRLFHIWGDKFNLDPTDLVFYHEVKVLCSLETIQEAEIKNGDKVVVAPHSLE